MPLRSRGVGSSRSSDCDPSTIAAEIETVADFVEQANEPARDVPEPDERQRELRLCHEGVGESASDVSKS
jgi:hypothetical protein